VDAFSIIWQVIWPWLAKQLRRQDRTFTTQKAKQPWELNPVIQDIIDFFFGKRRV